MRTLKIGATAPALRFYIADADGPVDLSTGVTALELETTGPEPFTAPLTADPDQATTPPVSATAGRGWCSCDPPGGLDAGRYACIVTRTTSLGDFAYPEDGYEVLDVQPGRNTAAAVTDVQRRMGALWADSYADQVGYLLDEVTGLLAEACDQTPAELCELEPIPPAVRVIAVEAVVRVLFNPVGAQARQETLGSYSHSDTFVQNGPNAAAGLMLTPTEERRARQAVFGASSGTARVRSTFNDAMVETGILDSTCDSGQYA